MAVRKAIVDYIKENLKGGYNPEQLRSYLVSRGYPPSDVDEAIRLASTGGSKRKLAIIIVIIAVVGGTAILLVTVIMPWLAWSSAQSTVSGDLSKAFEISMNMAYCVDGVIEVYIVNMAYPEGDLVEADFTLHTVDGTEIPLVNLPLESGMAARVIEWGCGGYCSPGDHEVVLKTISTFRQITVECYE